MSIRSYSLLLTYLGITIMTNSIFFNDYLNRNHASVGNLINDLYAHVCSRLLAIRVDFIYRPEYADQMTLEVVQEHRKRLLDNKRRNQTLFSDLLGYAWSLEYGSYNPLLNKGGNGFHHHFLFLFNGHNKNADMNIGLAIANYFDTVISHGTSRSYVSNLDKDKFEEMGQLGIGNISHKDIALRNNLLNHVAGYLTKDSMPNNENGLGDQWGSFRRFGRSQLPDPIPEGTVKPGRPRSMIHQGDLT